MLLDGQDIISKQASKQASKHNSIATGIPQNEKPGKIMLSDKMQNTTWHCKTASNSKPSSPYKLEVPF
jgi:hypothetical protein